MLRPLQEDLFSPALFQVGKKSNEGMANFTAIQVCMCMCMAVYVYVCLTDECVVCSQVKRVLGGNLGRGGAQMARLSLSDCPYVAVGIFCGVVRG